MKRYTYIRFLWISFLAVWGYVMPLAAQTIPTNGGALNNGTYTLTDNTTITGTLTIGNGKNVTVDLNGYVLRGNFSNGGYVFDVKEGGTLTIKDSQPSVAHAGRLDGQGRFVWGNDGSTMGVNGGIIYNLQKSGKSTRGISVSGTCIIERGKIMGCHSEDIGAAVVVTSSGSFTMKAGEIRYNYSVGADNGTRAGTIYGEPSHENQGSIINISNAIISDNNTLGNGGAICGYKVTLTGCTLENNTTTENGGAVYVRKVDNSRDPASLTINACSINNNSAVNGGAVFAEAGTSTTINDGSSFSGNKATKNGGGIYVYDLDINGTSSQKVLFEKNTAVTGGGLCVEKGGTQCNIEYCEINDNYAASDGGGIYAHTNTTIKNSWIQRNRAMSTEPEEWIYDKDGNRKLVNAGRGGGFYFQGISEKVEEVTNPNFYLENTLVEGNAAMYYGGGGQICSGGTLYLNNGSQIDRNIAVLHGAGGLHVTGTATVNINDGSSISGNTASTVGGAIHSSYGCTLNFNGGIIQNNIAHQRGGGVHINTGGGMLLKGTSIISNRVTRGPDIQYSTVIESNGIYSWTEPVAETSKSNYILDQDGNVEYSGYGGGVLIDSGTLTMDGGSISNNKAEIGGGGVALVMIRIGNMEGSSDSPEDKLKSILKDSRFYKYKVVQFTLNGGSIVGNSTTKTSSVDEEERLGYEIGNGAGVYIMENILRSKLGEKLTQAQWQEYSGGEGTFAKYEEIYQGVSKAIVTGGLMNENSASGRGGALFLQQGTVDMDNLTMNQNTAVGDGGGLYLHDGELKIESNENNEILGNKALNGGGICIANGTLSIGYCDIKNNQATNFGGGLYVANSEEVEITLDGGGVFNNNTAVAGGGMAVGGPITLNFQGSLQQNTAQNGGGIYLLPSTGNSKGTTLNFIGGFIRNNMANGTGKGITTGFEGTVEDIQGFGGGAFLGNGTTFKTTISEDGTFGFYDNKANIGGDDIFANGVGTTVILPKVATMDLTDFYAPTSEIYWVEDYVTNDTRYKDKGSNMIGDDSDTVRRYRNSLNASLSIYKILDTNFDAVKNKYLCLSLGYKILYMTIKKIGLQDGESSIFNIYNMKDDKFYLSTLLTGQKDKTKDGVSQKVAVPEGKWKVVENGNWTWNYTQSSVSPENGMIEIIENNTDEENTITFTNTLKETNKKAYDEAIKVNKMSGNSSNM